MAKMASDIEHALPGVLSIGIQSQHNVEDHEHQDDDHREEKPSKDIARERWRHAIQKCSKRPVVLCASHVVAVDVHDEAGNLSEPQVAIGFFARSRVPGVSQVHVGDSDDLLNAHVDVEVPEHVLQVGRIQIIGFVLVEHAEYFLGIGDEQNVLLENAILHGLWGPPHPHLFDHLCVLPRGQRLLRRPRGRARGLTNGPALWDDAHVVNVLRVARDNDVGLVLVVRQPG
mmetsp:Transcript_151997/g.487981  ORF Transcript_151997/g.487981 Transcript_151997/m.487981 type:complete len:229 (-) Transcript_151997:80-766(-)